MTSYSQVVEGGGRENVKSKGMKWGGEAKKRIFFRPNVHWADEVEFMFLDLGI